MGRMRISSDQKDISTPMEICLHLTLKPTKKVILPLATAEGGLSSRLSIRRANPILAGFV